MFLRRLGQPKPCAHGFACPQVLEMTDGAFAVVGQLITDEAARELPPGPGIGPREGVVKVPRAVMLSSMAEFFATAAV
jgi:hypothetical protein